MSDMTPERREILKSQLAALNEAEKQISVQMEPLRKAISAIDEAREVILEGEDVAGSCDECGKLLFVGEMGCRPYRDDDGILYCAEHAMTYADMVEQVNNADAFDDAEHHKAFVEMIEARRAAGTLDEKLLYEL